VILRSPPLRKACILLVDDQQANLDALRLILDSDEYELIEATSAQAALRLVLEHNFAVMLLDVKMPDIDGFQLASLIKQRQQARETPIIFVTAVATDLGFIFKGYDVGAVDYITKPLEPAVVKAKVAVFVQLFRKSELLSWQLEQLRDLYDNIESEAIKGRQETDALRERLNRLIELSQTQMSAIRRRQPGPSDMLDV
jgi:DNA-binding response OmpR family regulator